MKRLEKERARKVSRSTGAGQSCDSDKNIEGKQSSAQWAGNAKFLHSTTIFEFQKSLWFPKKGGRLGGTMLKSHTHMKSKQWILNIYRFPSPTCSVHQGAKRPLLLELSPLSFGGPQSLAAVISFDMLPEVRLGCVIVRGSVPPNSMCRKPNGRQAWLKEEKGKGGKVGSNCIQDGIAERRRTYRPPRLLYNNQRLNKYKSIN